MGKLLQVLSFLGLAVLVVGTLYAPQAPEFWLASGSLTYERIRMVLMFVILAQLVTRPPRHLAFRYLAGGIGIAVFIWVVAATYAYQMLFLDAAAFTAASIAVVVTALERRPVLPVVPFKVIRQI